MILAKTSSYGCGQAIGTRRDSQNQAGMPGTGLSDCLRVSTRKLGGRERWKGTHQRPGWALGLSSLGVRLGSEKRHVDQTHPELRWVSLLGSNAGFNTHSLLPACFFL